MAEEVKQPFECVVSADLFRRAMAAVSKEETRYYLNGVFVEPCAEGGVLLVATDGHCLLVFHDEHGVARNGSGIVQLNKDMIRAMSAKRWNLPGWLGPINNSGKRTRVVAVKGQKAAVVDAVGEGADIDHDAALALAEAPNRDVGGYQWMGALIDGAFPDWRKVIQTPEPGGVVGTIDPRKLAPVTQAIVFGGVHGFRLVPTTEGTKGPVYVVPYGKSCGFGVIMPIRDEAQGFAVPAWVAPQAVKKAA